MCFRRVSHAFRARTARILDASPSGKKGAWHSRTSCCSFIARLCTCTDTSCVHSRRVLHTFQARLECVSNVFERYLGAELYCTSCCSFIARFCACTDTSREHLALVLHVFRMRPACISHAFQTHSNVTLELICIVAHKM